MPELPDVEAYVEALRIRVPSQGICGVRPGISRARSPLKDAWPRTVEEVEERRRV